MISTKAKTILATLDAAKAGKCEVTIVLYAKRVNLSFKNDNNIEYYIQYDREHQDEYQDEQLVLYPLSFNEEHLYLFSITDIEVHLF